MSNEIVVQQKQALPAHLAELFKTHENVNDDLNSGLAGGFAVLSINGKEFTVVRGGNKQPVMEADKNGEEFPARSVEAIIIKANKNVSKVYYGNTAYVAGEDKPPVCWSSDGHKPDASVEKPQCNSCKICPHNQFGSRITDNGGKGKACSDSKRVAIALTGDIKMPMLLRLPVTSMKPLEEYGRLLQKRGVPYQSVVTRLSFEQGVTHPQLNYKPARFINEEEADALKEHMDSMVVEDILGSRVIAFEKDTDNGNAKEDTQKVAPAASAEKKPQTAEAAKKPEPSKPKPKSEPKSDSLFDEAPAEAKPAKSSSAVPAKAEEPSLEGKADTALDQVLATFDLDKFDI